MSKMNEITVIEEFLSIWPFAGRWWHDSERPANAAAIGLERNNGVEAVHGRKYCPGRGDGRRGGCPMVGHRDHHDEYSAEALASKDV